MITQYIYIIAVYFSWCIKISQLTFQLGSLIQYYKSFLINIILVSLFKVIKLRPYFIIRISTNNNQITKTDDLVTKKQIEQNIFSSEIYDCF